MGKRDNKLIKSKRGQMNFSFTWLLAIIVGAFILFLAIYASTKVVKTGDTGVSAKAGKEISALLNPLETGFESFSAVTLAMPVETRIHNQCYFPGNFGSQVIKVSQKSFNRWVETDTEARFSNKYIFSNGSVEGRNFIVFSKPFEFPFKVSDVIYMISSNDKYCFSEAPETVEDDLEDLGQDNIFAQTNGSCPAGSIKVCFGSNSGCNVTVDSDLKKVEKKNQTMYYETDALMYAAIFADKNIYECQVKRLMKRTEQLALIYDDKKSSLASQGCSDVIDTLGLAGGARAISNSTQSVSQDLVGVSTTANQVGIQNGVATCKLW